MKMNTAILVLGFLASQPSFAGMFSSEDELTAYAQITPSAPEASVKNLEKQGLYHTGNLLNKNIKNLSVKINRSAGEIKISFDYPSSEWGPAAFPIFVRLADKKGNVLDKFITNEDFVLQAYYDKMKPRSLGRQSLEERPELKQKKAVILKAKGNELKYDVNLRDAAFIQVVEVGFYTRTNHRGMIELPEFAPKNVFIRDWSIEK